MPLKKWTRLALFALLQTIPHILQLIYIYFEWETWAVSRDQNLMQPCWIELISFFQKKKSTYPKSLNCNVDTHFCILDENMVHFWTGKQLVKVTWRSMHITENILAHPFLGSMSPEGVWVGCSEVPSFDSWLQSFPYWFSGCIYNHWGSFPRPLQPTAIARLTLQPAS